MKTWLFKSEPSTWSWQDQLDAGAKGTGWDGVRNYQASNNMKAMALGDLGFFYHSVNEKCIVGIVEVIALYHPDHTDASGRFGMVDVKAVQAVNKPVTLAEIKANPKLEDLALVRQSRLSVVPVSQDHWAELLRMTDTQL
ncbi:MAG: EVE domain-containing protein [Proteobacteria bacterium]|jgi:predicted RNA-binding protein with PUA-like domain|nr:EVE domain-containing protein [Pseudomonadota bacterium]